MIIEDEIEKIKEVVHEFLEKITMTDFVIDIKSSFIKQESKEDASDAININIEIKEPQIFIGQNGQTLFELQKILRMILNKKLQKSFYVEIDINHYKSKKVEYVKKMAKDYASEVALSGHKKILPPMSGYERRIIHMELADSKDVYTESQSYGEDRYIVISPK